MLPGFGLRIRHKSLSETPIGVEKTALRTKAGLGIPSGWYRDQFPSKKPSIHGVRAGPQRRHTSRCQRRHTELKSIRNTIDDKKRQLEEATQGSAIWGQEAHK